PAPPAQTQHREGPLRPRPAPLRGPTENVARLAPDPGHLRPGAPPRGELDPPKPDGIASPAEGRPLRLERDRRTRATAPRRPAALKGPHRYGPFREAFRNRMVFVHGTRGTPAENAWALARARYDAETFWYRGNGSVDVLPDTAFDAARERDCNVILYGNADTNTAWKALLADSPVQVRKGSVSVGDRAEKGDNLACLFLRPRPGSARA